jgi:hypothetical protein
VSDIVKKLARIVTDDYGRYRTIRNMLDEAWLLPCGK